MANEIRGVSSTGTLYARVMDSEGRIYNGSSFETYNASNYSDYVIPMAEQGNSQVYVADFPVSITAGGTYEYFVHKQTGGTPSEGESVVTTGKIDWTGTVSVTVSAGSLTGSDWLTYVQNTGGFKRPDKAAEVFEATTDYIQILRRRFAFDEAKIDATTTDTITVLGDFKIAIESDLGMLHSVVLQDDENATKLIRRTRAYFNEVYPDINVTNDRGYPLDYMVYGRFIYIGPVPDQVSHTYRLNYSRSAGTIVASTAGVPFTALYRDMLREGVLEQLYTGLGEHDEATIHEAKFEAKYDECVRRERKNSGETSFNMAYRDF